MAKRKRTAAAKHHAPRRKLHAHVRKALAIVQALPRHVKHFSLADVAELHRISAELQELCGRLHRIAAGSKDE